MFFSTTSTPSHISSENNDSSGNDCLYSRESIQSLTFGCLLVRPLFTRRVVFSCSLFHLSPRLYLLCQVMALPVFNNHSTLGCAAPPDRELLSPRAVPNCRHVLRSRSVSALRYYYRKTLLVLPTVLRILNRSLPELYKRLHKKQHYSAHQRGALFSASLQDLCGVDFSRDTISDAVSLYKETLLLTSKSSSFTSSFLTPTRRNRSKA